MLKDYSEFANEPLAFPINGKTYTPPVLGAKTGVLLLRAMAGDPDILAQDSRSLWEILLGAAYQQMLDDDVPLDAVARAGFAMLVDWQGDREAAETVWESGIDPEARAAMAAALRGQASTPSTSSGSARKTPSPASTRRTTSRKATPRGKAKASNGRRSSSTGS